MYKKFSLVMISVLTLFAFVGCGNSEQPTPDPDPTPTPTPDPDPTPTPTPTPDPDPTPAFDPYDEGVSISGLEVKFVKSKTIYFGEKLNPSDLNVLLVLTKPNPTNPDEPYYLTIKLDNFSIDDSKVNYQKEGIYNIKITGRYLMFVANAEEVINVKADKYESLGVKHLFGIKCKSTTSVALGTNVNDIRPEDFYAVYTENKYEGDSLILIEEKKRTGYTLDLNAVNTNVAGSYPVYVKYSETYEGVTIEVETFFIVVVA